MQKTPDEKELIRYLLGNLHEKEQVRLEELYFTNNELFELLQAMEDELIDRYISGNLSDKEKKLFEKNYIQNPKRQQKVNHARSLIQTISEISGKSVKGKKIKIEVIRYLIKSNFSAIVNISRPMKLAYAVSLILVIFSVWSITQMSITQQYLKQLASKYAVSKQTENKLQQQLEYEKSERNELIAQLDSEQKLREKLEQQLEEERRQSLPLLSFVLSPGSLRDLSTPEKLILPAGHYKILLQLDIESEEIYQSYRAVIRDENNAVVWSKNGLKEKVVNGGRIIDIILNSGLISSESFQITLFGLKKNNVSDFIGKYNFDVKKNIKD